MTLSPEKSRMLILALLPCISDKYHEEFTNALSNTEYTQTPGEIFKAVCECVSAVTGVKNIQLTRRRTRHISRARQYVVWLMLAELRGTGLITYLELGAMFEPSFNHATIIHSKNAIDSLIATDPDARQFISTMVKLLDAHGYKRADFQFRKIYIIK